MSEEDELLRETEEDKRLLALRKSYKRNQSNLTKIKSHLSQNRGQDTQRPESRSDLQRTPKWHVCSQAQVQLHKGVSREWVHASPGRTLHSCRADTPISGQDASIDDDEGSQPSENWSEEETWRHAEEDRGERQEAQWTPGGCQEEETGEPAAAGEGKDDEPAVRDRYRPYNRNAPPQHFIDYINASHPTIKFTYESSPHTVDFLDLTVYKGDRYHSTGLLDIKPFFKKTNKFQYSHYTSAHPKNTFRSLVKGELTRLLRACSDEETYNNIVHKLKYSLTEITLLEYYGTLYNQ